MIELPLHRMALNNYYEQRIVTSVITESAGVSISSKHTSLTVQGLFISIIQSLTSNS